MSLSAEKDEAADAIRHIGTNAVPYLLTWLRYEEPPGKRKRLDTVNKLLGWLNAQLGAAGSWTLKDQQGERARGACLAFAALGPEAKAAIPELSRLLCAPNGTPGDAGAALALANLADLGLPPLVAALTNADAHVRVRAVFNMEHLGTNARPAVPMLINTMRDNDWFAAWAAARTLSELQLEPDLVVPALTNCLKDPDIRHRVAATEALEKFGRAALSAVPPLLIALSDTNRYVQSATRSALQEIAPEAMTNAAVFAIATNALQSPHRHLRIWAASALPRFGLQARSQVPPLVSALSDPDWAVRGSSIVALGELGENAASAVPALLNSLSDTNALVRDRAVKAIRVIVPEVLTNAPPR